jgi:hypothetical protein
MSDVQQLEHRDEEPPDERPGTTGVRKVAERWSTRLEVVIAIALGLAAIAGAFAAYRSEQENHHASAHFSEGIANFDEAGQLFAAANATLSRDQAQFLAYATALHDRKAKLADFIRHHLMDARLQTAVAWWEGPANVKQAQPATTPFVSGDPGYTIPERTQALRRTRDSTRRFEEAKVDQDNADHYELIEVILATSLFLYGIAGVTRSMPVKLGTLATGGAIFLISLVLLIT